MLDLERVFQMHPTLTANQPPDFLLPLAHQPYKPPIYRSHQERQEYGNHTSSSVRLPDRSLSTAPPRDGLHTPPEEMTGANLNPPRPLPYACPVPSNGYFPKPHSSSNSAGFGTLPPASFTGTSRTVEKAHGGLQSPTGRKDLSAPPEPLQRRKSSCSNNSIVSYLQIPSSINDSKGSLAEFAAQVAHPDSMAGTRELTDGYDRSHVCSGSSHPLPCIGSRSRGRFLSPQPHWSLTLCLRWDSGNGSLPSFPRLRSPKTSSCWPCCSYTG